jgi:WD40 repeat protein
MASRSVRLSIKAGMVLAVAGIALGVSAVARNLPGALTEDAPDAHPAAAAEELGRLQPAEAYPDDETCSLAVSPDGTLLATGARDGVVRLWDASSLRPLARWPAHPETVTALAFLPDSRGLLSAGADHTVGRWSVAEAAAPRPDGRWPVAGRVTALAVAADGRTVAVAANGRIGFHDAAGGAALPGAALPGGELSVPESPIRALAFAPDGRSLAAGGGGDNAVRVWALGGCRRGPRLTLGENADTCNWVRALAYTADSCTLVSLDTGGLVRAWDGDGNRIGEARAGPALCVHASLGGGARLVLATPGGQEVIRLLRLPDALLRGRGAE